MILLKDIILLFFMILALPPEISTLIFVQCDVRVLRKVCTAIRSILPTRVHRYEGRSLDHYAFLTTCAGVPLAHCEIRPNLTITHIFNKGALVRAVILHKKRKFICEVVKGPPRFNRCVIFSNTSLEYRHILDGSSIIIKCSECVKLIQNSLITFYL